MEYTISIGRRGLTEWTSSGLWPCSDLRGAHRLQATFRDGDLIDLHVWGGSPDDLTAAELDAVIDHFGTLR